MTCTFLRTPFENLLNLQLNSLCVFILIPREHEDDNWKPCYLRNPFACCGVKKNYILKQTREINYNILSNWKIVKRSVIKKIRIKCYWRNFSNNSYPTAKCSEVYQLSFNIHSTCIYSPQNSSLVRGFFFIISWCANMGLKFESCCSEKLKLHERNEFLWICVSVKIFYKIPTFLQSFVVSNKSWSWFMLLHRHQSSFTSFDLFIFNILRQNLLLH